MQQARCHDPLTLTLVAIFVDKERSFRAEGARNVLLQGDSAQVLREYPSKYRGAVRVVYADPPYNIGSHRGHYADRLSPEAWVASVRSVLEPAWALLREDGSLWVSIDDRSIHLLRVLLDQVCGAACHVATCVWQKRTGAENRGALGDAHEYVVVYAKAPRVFASSRNKLPKTESQRDVYANPDQDPRGPWRSVSLLVPRGTGRRNQVYEITNPAGAVLVPPVGRAWRYVRTRFESLLLEGVIIWGRGGAGAPRRKIYLSDHPGVIPSTWWTAEECGTTGEGTREQHALFGFAGGIETPKPERLMARILGIASNPGDLVLDPYAGSGTTAVVAYKLGRVFHTIECGTASFDLTYSRLRRTVERSIAVGVPYQTERTDGFRVCAHSLSTE